MTTVARGMSLPEVMVALALGLGIGLTALTAWHALRASGQAFLAQQSLQHNARMAWAALRTQALLAGGAQLLGVAGSAGVRPTSAETLARSAVQATDGGPRGSDTLQLVHWRSLDAQDCLGQSAGSQPLVASQFQRSTSTVDDLACKDTQVSGSTFQSLAEGVRDLQVWLAEVSADGQGLQWKTPAQVSDPARVVALRVCLHMTTPEPVREATGGIGCREEAVASDGRLHHTVTHTLALRARLGLWP